MHGRRLLSITTVLTLFALLCGVSTTTAAARAGLTSVKPGALTVGPYLIQFKHSHKCVVVPNFSTTNVSLQQWTCVNQGNEQFYFDYVFTAEPYNRAFYRIRNAHSGKCVMVAGQSQQNGAAIMQYPCGAYPNQYFAVWRRDYVPDGWYWLEAYHSQKTVHVGGASQANGANLIQWTRCLCDQGLMKLI